MPLDAVSNRPTNPRARFTLADTPKVDEYSCYGQPYSSCYRWASGAICTRCLTIYGNVNQCVECSLDCPGCVDK